MESKVIVGIGILIFSYGLFSWALGRYLNKTKKKETNEIQNFLSGAWIIGAVLLAMTLWLYFG